MAINDSQRSDQLDMLAQALQQQRRTVRGFELMLAAAARREDKRSLSAMQREDRRHYYLLEGIYEEISGQAYRSPKTAVAMPRQYVSMLQVMIRNKLDAIDFYEKLNDTLDCLKHKELLTIVISDQKEQARLLAEIYNNSL